MSVANKEKENRRRCYKCGRSPSEDPLTALYRFPRPGKTNTVRCELWAKYSFPDKEYWLTEFQNKLYTEHKMLCNRHFPRTSFSDYPLSSMKLHRFAVPGDSNETEPQPSPLYYEVQDSRDVTKLCLPIVKKAVIDPFLGTAHILYGTFEEENKSEELSAINPPSQKTTNRVMSGLILHRAFGSPPARAVLMLSELIGLQPEIKEVNLLRLEHKTPEFRKLNPMTTVPVLQDGDFVLSESHAIMKYLLGKYGGDKGEVLYPPQLRTRALVDQCMYFDAGVFFRALVDVAGETLFDKLPGPTDIHIQRIEESYSVLEAYLQDRKYVATDHLTLADLSNGSTAAAIQVMHKLDANKYPRCADWLARLQEEHVFKTINAPGAAFLAKILTKFWNANKDKHKKADIISK